MTIVHAVVLGAVQGITEFLPISSSGHLIIFPEVFGWEPNGMTFDVAVHVATLLAIVVAMRSDIVDMVRRLLRHEASAPRLVAFLAIATVPAVIAGGMFGDWFDGVRTIPIIATSLIVWGIILAVADRVAARAKPGKGLYGLTWFQALFIGLVQVFALIPGTSRSGSTMSAGLLTGLDRETAARFSFLLAIPAIAGAGLLTGLDVAKAGLDVGIPELLAGAVAAFISGIVAIKFLMFVIKRANFLWFAGYRIILGLMLLLFLG
ncbi:MAG: Undecaprenyl-diphosphatase [Candidatus Uhrbacteria bacterium GW2011_GWD2_52_7]|uniref:Undecaprenyl-diphosphatase n=1 Tax=Candidatus Uhrbacteria bacterium GW2011_GWD2_52_7 TaxID=1618989 RepID=A0A0G1XGB1_9BACT|nr:MAG: Undecaprenyl-diphosphatase [Candidatus Uhrbacteria bacterium GW2011_GWD2_52_7]